MDIVDTLKTAVVVALLLAAFRFVLARVPLPAPLAQIVGLI